MFSTTPNCDIWSENIWGSDEIKLAHPRGRLSDEIKLAHHPQGRLFFFTLNKEKEKIIRKYTVEYNMERASYKNILKGSDQSIFGPVSEVAMKFPSHTLRFIFSAMQFRCSFHYWILLFRNKCDAFFTLIYLNPCMPSCCFITS